MAEVGGHMQEERVLQSLNNCLSKQLMHQLRQHRLQGLLMVTSAGTSAKFR